MTNVVKFRKTNTLSFVEQFGTSSNFQFYFFLYKLKYEVITTFKKTD